MLGWTNRFVAGAELPFSLIARVGMRISSKAQIAVYWRPRGKFHFESACFIIVFCEEFFGEIGGGEMLNY